MRLFRFLADFRYFQGKFHHFCESTKSGLKLYRVWGCFGPETVLTCLRCQLDNSEDRCLLDPGSNSMTPALYSWAKIESWWGRDCYSTISISVFSPVTLRHYDSHLHVSYVGLCNVSF